MSDTVQAMSSVIDGKLVAARVRERVAREVAELVASTGRAPALATILVGDDPASAVYVENKRRLAKQAGIGDRHAHLPADSRQETVAALIDEFGADPQVSGILLQLPLPAGLDASELTARIPPQKDVDGLTPASTASLWQGRPGLRPCTPLGVIELLDAYDVALRGAEVVIVGRSELVGKPLAALMLQRDATVTVCHSRTRSLAEVCARADVLVAAAGMPGLIGAEHVKAGAVVIDVGINRTAQGLVGDVDFPAAAARASLITPVPGGVGPMTIAMLLSNTVSAARLALRDG